MLFILGGETAKSFSKTVEPSLPETGVKYLTAGTVQCVLYSGISSFVRSFVRIRLFVFVCSYSFVVCST